MRDAVRLLTPAVLFACGDGGVSAIEYPPNDVAFEWLRGEELVSTEAPSTLAYALAADPRSNRLVLLDFYADEPLVILEPDGTIVSRLGGRGTGRVSSKTLGVSRSPTDMPMCGTALCTDFPGQALPSRPKLSRCQSSHQQEPLSGRWNHCRRVNSSVSGRWATDWEC